MNLSKAEKTQQFIAIFLRSLSLYGGFFLAIWGTGLALGHGDTQTILLAGFGWIGVAWLLW